MTQQATKKDLLVTGADYVELLDKMIHTIEHLNNAMVEIRALSTRLVLIHEAHADEQPELPF